MDLKAFSKANRRRCEAPDGFNHPLNSWTASDWMTAVIGELGEAANVVKKLNRIRDGIPGNKETEFDLERKLEQELSDTFIYLDLLAQSMKIDLSESVPETFDAKSQSIGYFSREHDDWCTPDEIASWREAVEHGVTSPENAEWLTAQLNAAFRKGRQVQQGLIRDALKQLSLSLDMHRSSPRP